MRKLLNVVLALLAMTFVACGGDDPIPEPTPTPTPDNQENKLYPDELYPAVDGRVVLSYVTYYGSAVPDVTEIATGKRLCAYDNPKSIVMKGDFARGSGLKGMMSWEYDQDDAKLTLNKAMW